jgi:hypothetical protein
MKVAIQRNGRQRGKSVPLKAVSILRLCAMLLLTPRNYAGCQIERCTHQSRDEPFGKNSHVYDVGRGYGAFLTHLLQKKRLFLSEIGVYLSRALTVEGFWAYGRLATAPVIPDQHGGYYPPRLCVSDIAAVTRSTVLIAISESRIGFPQKKGGYLTIVYYL